MTTRSDILAVDLIRALWEDARRETDPARKAQMERDAVTMEDVWSRSGYALAATRDQMTAALGNASLNIADTLSTLALAQHRLDERVGEIHQHVQEGHTLISAFVGNFPTQFAGFQSEMRTAIEEAVQGLGRFSDDIELLRQDIGALQHVQAVHGDRLDALDADKVARDDDIRQ